MFIGFKSFGLVVYSVGELGIVLKGVKRFGV